ncbi:MAG TPA: glycerophosphodiester phosphodiesterase family protein [Novosphingobium sp.]|nr:glycerophosphodiester phosphodiesterase family protein [Novosphingobium sp.]HNN54834.1 glycerophosphodiester phosphodiesterase family protein [Novosphingobium sp.]
MRGWLALIALGALALPASATIVIGHRGASGERPEHTLASYERAIDQGADYIEPDLVPTRDGVLVARHENEISGTTDVADHPEFASRKATRTIDGETLTGWFVEDFTLAELRTLRAKERLPAVRKANTAFDRLYPVPTFAEVIALVRAKQAESGREIGIYPEIKHPAYLATRGFDMPALLVAQLDAAGLNRKGARVFIQCFEVGPLERLRTMTPLPLIQLVSADGGPADRPGTSYAAMLRPEGLKAIATHADGIGAELTLLLDEQGKARPLVAEAHRAGLLVHAWTLRRENRFLPPLLRRGSDPNAPGDIARAWKLIRAAGIDGVFTDNPGSIPRRR